MRKKSRMWPNRKKKAQLIVFGREGENGGRKKRLRLRLRDCWTETVEMPKKKKKKKNGDDVVVESFTGVFRSLFPHVDATHASLGVESVDTDALVSKIRQEN